MLLYKYKITVWKYTFMLRAALGVFRLQEELCQFLFFLSGKTCCYTKLQSGTSRFCWEVPLIYLDFWGYVVEWLQWALTPIMNVLPRSEMSFMRLRTYDFNYIGCACRTIIWPTLLLSQSAFAITIQLLTSFGMSFTAFLPYWLQIVELCWFNRLMFGVCLRYLTRII